MADAWLNVYDTSGTLKARIFECPISECSTRCNTFGILRFPIHQDAQGRDQLQAERWIEVYRQTASGGDTLWAGIICHVKKMFDENGDPTRYYEVTARSFEWVPYWRRMVPGSGQDYFYKNGLVDDAAKYLVRYCMETGYAAAARVISGFTVEADDSEHADTKTLAGRYEDRLGDKLEAWAKAYDFDWWVSADCPNAAFVLRTKVPRRGSDLSASVVLTVGRHNLLALEYYEDDLDTAQLCYVGGPGEGATQIIRTVYDGAEPTGWNRREMYVPLSNAEYTDELDVGGHAWLDSFGDTLTGVRFELNETEAAKWRTDFDIGDLVTVYDADFGVDKVAEIKETNYTWDEDGVEHIELLVGEPQPSKWDLLQAGVGAYSSFDDDAAPATPVGLSVSTGTAQDEDGHWHSYLTVSWTANTELDIGGYEVKWTVGGSTSSKSTKEISHYIFPVDANSAYSVAVKAVDRAGNESAYCTAKTGTTAKDTIAPATPANLAVTAAKKAIRITVDKNAEGDWAGNEFHISTSTGFTPSSATLVHSGKSTTYTYNTASYVVHYVKVRAYDNSGNFSGYTAQGSATPDQVSTPDVTLGGLDGDTVLGNLSVGTGKIGNLAVTTAKIDNLAVTTGKIDNLAVTDAKINSLAASKITAGTLIATVLIEATSIKAGTITAQISIQSAGTIGFLNGPQVSGSGGQLWVDAGLHAVSGLSTGGGIQAITSISTNSYVLCSYLAISDGITAPSTTSGQAKIYVDSADGDLKVKFGDGTIKTIVTD